MKFTTILALLPLFLLVSCQSDKGLQQLKQSPYSGNTQPILDVDGNIIASTFLTPAGESDQPDSIIVYGGITYTRNEHYRDTKEGFSHVTYVWEYNGTRNEGSFWLYKAYLPVLDKNGEMQKPLEISFLSPYPLHNPDTLTELGLLSTTPGGPYTIALGRTDSLMVRPTSTQKDSIYVLSLTSSQKIQKE